LILQEFYSSRIRGHAGFLRTYTRIAPSFAWQGVHCDVRAWVRAGQVCQRAKHVQTSPARLLSPFPIPNKVWVIIGLPVSRGYSVIFVVVDCLSKYGHFALLQTSFTVIKVAKVFVANVVKLHGFPRSIVSDRDKVFISSFWQHLFKLHGTSLKMSPAYHPQTDGQSEAVNKCLEMYLHCFSSDQPHQWVQFFPWAEFWYNSSFHTSMGMTSFKVLYGNDPLSIIPTSINEDTPSDLQQQL